MAKYLAMGSLTVDGVKALRKEKASGRRAAVTKIFEAAGGKVEAGYYAFGERDVFFILEFPDNVSATSVSLVINSSGLIRGTITPLITLEEMDRAIDKAAGLPVPAR